jgi:hypothetical protein
MLSINDRNVWKTKVFMRGHTVSLPARRTNVLGKPPDRCLELKACAVFGEKRIIKHTYQL